MSHCIGRFSQGRRVVSVCTCVMQYYGSHVPVGHVCHVTVRKKKEKKTPILNDLHINLSNSLFFIYVVIVSNSFS